MLPFGELKKVFPEIYRGVFKKTSVFVSKFLGVKNAKILLKIAYFCSEK